MEGAIDVITTAGLTKRFGDTVAVDGLELAVPEGGVYGFLGPNGAGKTTTLRLLAGLLRPTAGSARVLGFEVPRRRLEVQARIGYLPGEVHLYGDLTGEENLEFLGRLHRLPSHRTEALLDRFELPPAVLERRVGTYSRGMQRKLGLVAALQHDPPLYILDEPTEGLDPLMQAAFVELVEEEVRRGKTLLLSSHALTEVERTCDRVAMVRRGRLVFEGSLADVRSRALHRLEAVFASPVEIAWKDFPNVVEVHGSPRHHLVMFRGDARELLRRVVDLPVEDLSVGTGSLEETFLTFYRESSGEES